MQEYRKTMKSDAMKLKCPVCKETPASLAQQSAALFPHPGSSGSGGVGEPTPLDAGQQLDAEIMVPSPLPSPPPQPETQQEDTILEVAPSPSPPEPSAAQPPVEVAASPSAEDPPPVLPGQISEAGVGSLTPTEGNVAPPAPLGEEQGVGAIALAAPPSPTPSMQSLHELAERAQGIPVGVLLALQQRGDQRKGDRTPPGVENPVQGVQANRPGSQSQFWFHPMVAGHAMG